MSLRFAFFFSLYESPGNRDGRTHSGSVDAAEIKQVFAEERIEILMKRVEVH